MLIANHFLVFTIYLSAFVDGLFWAKERRWKIEIHFLVDGSVYELMLKPLLRGKSENDDIVGVPFE